MLTYSLGGLLSVISYYSHHYIGGYTITFIPILQVQMDGGTQCSLWATVKYHPLAGRG